MANKLSPQQQQQFKQAFKVFDVNNDGRISPNELKTIMKQFGYTTSEEEVDQMFKNIDQGHHGDIKLEDFLNFMGNQQASLPEDQTAELRQAFKMFDKDGNGLISKEELQECLAKLGETMTQAEVQQLISAADLDGDGNINFQQFAELMGNK